MKTPTSSHGIPYEEAKHYYGKCGAYFQRLDFDNGYAVSIVSHQHSYGGASGNFEVAVLRADTGQLVYDTAVANDVLGHLDFAEVSATIAKVRALSKRCWDCHPSTASPGYSGPEYH